MHFKPLRNKWCTFLWSTLLFFPASLLSSSATSFSFSRLLSSNSLFHPVSLPTSSFFWFFTPVLFLLYSLCCDSSNPAILAETYTQPKQLDSLSCSSVDSWGGLKTSLPLYNPNLHLLESWEAITTASGLITSLSKWLLYTKVNHKHLGPEAQISGSAEAANL